MLMSLSNKKTVYVYWHQYSTQYIYWHKCSKRWKSGISIIEHHHSSLQTSQRVKVNECIGWLEMAQLNFDRHLPLLLWTWHTTFILILIRNLIFKLYTIIIKKKSRGPWLCTVTTYVPMGTQMGFRSPFFVKVPIFSVTRRYRSDVRYWLTE